MGAVMNGLALHGGFIPYGGTFLTFSDYARNSIRMAALMHQRVIFVLTHDSIGLGEDGPTHQAVEHLASLRLIPGLEVWRPADAVETAVAWKCALQPGNGPTALALSRQSVAQLEHTPETVALSARGGYVLVDSDGPPELILLATGSEVGLAVECAAALDGIRDTGRIDALHGTVCPAGPGLPGTSPAERGFRPDRGRGGESARRGTAG